MKSFLERLRNHIIPDKRGRITKEKLRDLLPSNPIIIEAGAHIGVDTLEMSRLWPKGHIYAFEPVPKIFERLKFNTRHQKNITCYQMALGDSIGDIEMHISSGASDGSSSLLPPKEHLKVHPNVYFHERITIYSTILDAWMEDHNIDHADFLWLDMQGYEMATLQASPRALSTVRAIHTEVAIKEVYENTPLYPEFRSWLASQGFEVHIEALDWEDVGNVLFVRK